MNWIQYLKKALQYIEKHLTDEINIDDIASQTYTSSSHFQLMFHLVTGMTAGEYIRNRRLSSAAQDLLQPNSKVIDVAMKYQYDTSESFSKAFTRFHGVPPSKVQRGLIHLFYPLTIDINIQGGFYMAGKFIDDMVLVNWSEIDGQRNEKTAGSELYNRLVNWAQKARGQNPSVFDAMTEWILDDSQWGDDKLAENEQILLQGVFARLKEENAKLRAYLKEIEPSGVVNDAIFNALDKFDEGLSGAVDEPDWLCDTVSTVFADFSKMRERGIREKIAGGKTGPYGNDKVDLFGYVSHLKDLDAGVQWALFMPQTVKDSLDARGLTREKFEYIELGKVRFIGLDEIRTKKGTAELLIDGGEFLSVMDSLAQEYSATKINDNCVLIHHNGTNHEEIHILIGRFFKADTPVPEGYDYFDVFTEKAAYAIYNSEKFSGDLVHGPEDAYSLTRNQILGNNVNIPFPQAYWHAVVFTNGLPVQGKYRYGYMFSVGEPRVD